MSQEDKFERMRPQKPGDAVASASHIDAQARVKDAKDSESGVEEEFGEGDRALLDVANRVSEGEHGVEHDGKWKSLEKTEGSKAAVVVARVTDGESEVEHTQVVINSPATDPSDIEVTITKFSPKYRGGKRVSFASGNNIGTTPINVFPDPEGAQARKLDAANRISEINEILEQEQAGREAGAGQQT